MLEVTAAWGIAKVTGELGKKLYDFGKTLKDREAQREVDEIADQLRGLKRSAEQLEDQNRELKEKLRFKSADFDFRTPFWYEKAHSERALCPKCYAKEITAPMGEQGRECAAEYRRCLVCDDAVQVEPKQPRTSPHISTDWQAL